MITLEKACENLMSELPYPIEFITETDTHWAIFHQVEDGYRGILVPAAEKNTGHITMQSIFDYMYQPRVPVPEKYRVGTLHC